MSKKSAAGIFNDRIKANRRLPAKIKCKPRERQGRAAVDGRKMKRHLFKYAVSFLPRTKEEQ